MAEVEVLNVALQGRTIGALTHLGGDRTIFVFAEDYINDPARPTLGLFFKDEFGQLRTDFRPFQTQVMPFFSNLLPEGPLRSYLARKAGVNARREFQLLRALGQDLPGAITMTPAEGDDSPAGGNEDMAEGQGGRTMLRFSLAGVQLKFSAVHAAGGGLTIPASGIGGNWIVKLPSRDFPAVPENEFSMMTLAGLLGMNVPAIDLVPVKAIAGLPEGVSGLGDHAFVIARFDRLSGGQRVHMEDFAQVYGVYAEDKYRSASLRNIAQVIAAEGSDADIDELIRRITFTMLIGDADMHLKNWSILYPDRRQVTLAPAYDFVSTVPYLPGDGTNMTISRVKRFSGFSAEELSHLAIKAAIPKKRALDVARQTVALFRQHWATEKAHLPMTASVRTAIEAHLQTVPIYRELG